MSRARSVEAPLRPHDGFELRPPGLEPLLAVDLLALGRLLEPGVDVRPFVLVEGELGEAALVVDWYRRLVLDRALDVVDADVVAEHRAGVGVLERDRCSGEADEGGVRQRVAHVAGEAVDEVVLAAVCLVGDDDHVAPPREEGMPVALLFGEEFLDGGEHHAARIDREPGPEVGAALGLNGRLTQEVATAREGREELVVEVVPIGQHDDGGVRHRRLADDAPGVEGHGEALARALGMPDDADAPITRLPARLASRLVPAALLPQSLLGRAQGLGDRRLDGVELVVARHLLREPAAAVVLEHDEVTEEGEKAARLERPLDRHLELGEEHGGQLLARDRAPGLEPLPSAGEGAEPGLDPVRDREHRVEGEEGGHLRPVGPELLPGAADGRVFGRRVLELDDGERQAVHEQHDVGAALAVVLDHRELVDREPVVVGRPLEVEHPHGRSPDRAGRRCGTPPSPRPRPCGGRRGCGLPGSARQGASACGRRRPGPRRAGSG